MLSVCRLARLSMRERHAERGLNPQLSKLRHAAKLPSWRWSRRGRKDAGRFRVACKFAMHISDIEDDK